MATVLLLQDCLSLVQHVHDKGESSKLSGLMCLEDADVSGLQ